MINARRTGAYISRLRKEKDWTQVDLAERLHVTNQAVSRWETGESYPDVTLLVRLAELFGVTVDDLLNGGLAARSDSPLASAGQIVAELGQGRPERVAELVRENPGNLDAVIGAAPLTRPSTIRKVVENLEHFKFDASQLAALAPFVDPELLDSILLDLDPAEIDGGLLSALAPFLPEGTLDRLAAALPADKVQAGWLGWLLSSARQRLSGWPAALPTAAWMPASSARWPPSSAAKRSTAWQTASMTTACWAII